MRKLSLLGVLVVITALVGWMEASAEEGFTFKEVRNKYSDYIKNGGDISKVTGFKRSADWKDRAVFDNVKVQAASLPKHWDWREVSPMRKARDQGMCGSCWAQSSSGVTELVWQLLHPKTVPQLLLAPQALVSCSKYNCDGGDFDVFDYIQSKGLPNEAKYPYTGTNSACKAVAPDVKITRWAFVGSGEGGNPTTAQIKQAIYDHGPVSVDIAATDRWSSYGGGIYNGCDANSSKVNHMTVITGWDDTDGKGYWIMLNSWGTGWGENGFMKTRYVGKNGKKCNAIGDTTAYAIVDGVENLRTHLGLK